MILPHPYTICFGEILWDVYRHEKRLGGTPFNAAAKLNKLGTNSLIFTRIGNDELGFEILGKIENRRIETSTVQIDKELTTGIVQVELDSTGKPRYYIYEHATWDYIT